MLRYHKTFNGRWKIEAIPYSEGIKIIYHVPNGQTGETREPTSDVLVAFNWSNYEKTINLIEGTRSLKSGELRFEHEILNPLLPSKPHRDDWLIAKRKARGFYPEATHRAGCFVIGVDESEVDEQWQIVKELTEDGWLGEVSRVSTKGNPRVICVYAYNKGDVSDLERIENQLKDKGFKGFKFKVNQP